MKNRYTEEEKAFLLEHGPHLSNKELHELLNAKFLRGHSEGSVRTTCKKLGVLKSKETRRRISKQRAQPIGTEKEVNGFWYVRINDKDGFYNSWKPKHIFVWETENGPVPDGYMIVFLDGNRNNFSPDNLTCISKRVAAKMINGHGKSFWSESPEIIKTGLLVCELDLVVKGMKGSD